MGLNKKVVFDFYNVIYTSNTGEVDIEVLALISKIHQKGIPLYIFTNTSLENIEQINKNSPNPFLHYFTKIIDTSAHPKPSRKAYENLIKELKSFPKDIILIDDREENVKVAMEFDIISILYLNPKDLEIKLNKILNHDN
jgi:HAD superfamily hydrolase (TIGR01509 family)